MRASWNAAGSLLSALLWLTPAAGSALVPRPDTALVRLGDARTGTGAFVAYPAARGATPALIVGHEWWGLNGQIRSVARRLAAEGYVAIVPDLYHGKVADDPERAHVLMRGLETDAANADLDAAARWLRANPRVEGRRIGVIGFCMGGGVALEYGIHDRDVAAVVVFYGPPVTDTTRLARLGAPVLAHFGRLDEGIPGTRVAAFRDAMKQAGRTAEVYEYSGAGHAFMNDTRPSYQPDAARLAWARTLAFLQKRLRDRP